MSTAEHPRFEHQGLQLHHLGPRAVGEFLTALAAALAGHDELDRLLGQYHRLTPEMLRALGGDRFPPRPLVEVPDDLEQAA